MSLPVVLRDEAQTEFDEGFDYYEAQRAGLGDVGSLRHGFGSEGQVVRTESPRSERGRGAGGRATD
ncbi:MAG: hypothetical protein JWO38_7841 [Gemmataceae bacterium]|nr:hypothetical protein [Gemmataceae bacterium]